MDSLENRTNPFATFVAGAIRWVCDEPVEPCLDPGELKPLSAPYEVPAQARPRPPSVIIVAVESLRADVVGLRHQGQEVTPCLNRLAAGGLWCTRAYSQSTHSDYADVCIVSSLYPLRKRHHHYYRSDDPWPKTLVYDVLRPRGYATAIISSQNERWGAMDRFLESPRLDLFYDAERSDAADVRTGDIWFREAIGKEIRRGKLSDRHTVDVAARWVEGQAARDRPFFLSVNLQTSHFPYTLPPGADAPFRPATIDFDVSFLYYPEDKAEVVRNAYFNALHETDRQIGRLVEALRRAGRLDDTILAVVGENGEAFHERGLVTHAQEPIEPAVRVACVLHCPQKLKPAREDYPVELIDLVPTVFGLLGLPPHDNFQGTDFLSASRVPAAERLLFLHAESVISRADAVILGGRWKLLVDRKRGTAGLYDVVADPGELRDLTAERPELAAKLREVHATWRRRQLAYYHYPQYYQHYYPPRPPQWAGGPVPAP